MPVLPKPTYADNAEEESPESVLLPDTGPLFDDEEEEAPPVSFSNTGPLFDDEDPIAPVGKVPPVSAASPIDTASPVVPFSNPIDLFSNIIEQTQPQEAPQGPPAVAPIFSPSVSYPGPTEEPQEAVEEFAPGIYEDDVLLESESLNSLDIEPYNPTAEDLKKEDAEIAANTLSFDRVREDDLIILMDQGISELAKGPKKFAYINSIFNESQGIMGQRPRDKEFIQHRREVYGETAKIISESSGEGETPNEVLERLNERQHHNPINFFDPNKLDKEEYGFAVLEDEMIKAQLPASARVELHDILRQKYDNNQPTYLDRLMYNPANIDFGASVAGDTMRLMGGASNAVGGLLYMTAGTAVLPLTSKKFSLRGRRAVSPIEDFALRAPDINRLINWKLTGQETEFYPDDIFASVVHEKKLPAVLDPFFSQAIDISLSGDYNSTATDITTSAINKMYDVAGSFNVPVFSPSEVVRTTNLIAENKETILEQILDKSIEIRSKSSASSQYTGFRLEPNPLSPDWPSIPLGEEGKEYGELQGETYSVSMADAELIFSRIAGANFFGKEAVGQLSEENQEYAKIFLPYFPERDSTVGSKSFEVIDKAAEYIFEQDKAEGFGDPTDILGALNMDKRATYLPYVNELMTAIPEERRNAFLQVMWPEHYADESESLKVAMAPFTGDALALDALKKQAFQEVASLYVSMKENEQVQEMAREGGFGPEWQLKGRTEQEQDIYYSLVPTMIVMEQLIRTSEFASTADSFLSTVAGSMEELPYHMALSFAGIWNTFSSDDYKIGTEQFQKNAAHKVKNETFFAVADFAALTWAMSRLGKSGVISAAAMKDTAANLVKKPDASIIQTIVSIGTEFNKNRKSIGDNIRAVSEKPPADPSSVKIDLGLEENVLPKVQTDVITPDTTTIAYRRDIKVLEEKLKDQTLDGPTRDNYSTQLIQQQRLLEVSLAALEGSLEWTQKVENVSGDLVPQKRKQQHGVSFQEERIEASQRSSITPGQYEGIKGKTATERKVVLAEQIETRLTNLDDLYTYDPETMKLNADRAKKKLDDVASEYGINDYSSPIGTRSMVKALEVMLIDDPIVWKQLFENSRAFETIPSNKVIASYAARVRNTKFKKGVEAKVNAMREIEKGPIQILSEETKKSPREVKNRRDAIAIAEELAESGAEPWQFLGLGLEQKVLSEILENAANSQKKAAILQKTTDMVGRRHDVVVFERDGAVGTASPGDAAAYSKSPTHTSGPSPTETGLGRVGRVGMHRGLGDRGMNLMNEYRATGKKRYGLAAMFEAMSRPFAVLNIPAWYRSATSEIVLHAWANGWTDVGGANSSWAKRLALSTASMLAKPSLLVGADAKLLLAEHEGKIYEKKVAIDKDFDPNLEGFTATNERVVEIFGDEARLDGKDIVFSQTDVHNYGWLLSRETEGVIIIDNKSGKKYRVTDIFEKTVDAKGKLVLERKMYQAGLDILEAEYAQTGSPKSLARIGSIEARILEIDQTIQSKKTIVNVNELFPDMELLKAELEATTNPIEKAVIKDKIDILSSITAREISEVVSTPGYRSLKPVAAMDEFEMGLLVLLNDIIQPRSAKVFDLVVQWINGKNSTRIMFENNVGNKHIVVQETIVAGKTRYKVVKTFPDTLDGELAAAEFRKRADIGKKDIKDPTKGKERVVIQEEGRGSAAEVSEATGGIGTLQNVSGDFLTNRAFDGSFKAPRLPGVKSHLEISGHEFIKSATNYMSTYYEAAKLHAHIEKLSKEIIDSGATPQMIQHQFRALAKQILSGTNGGLKMLNKHGGDVILAAEEVMAMTAEQEISIFGGKLSQTERFAMEASYKKVFKSEHLLEVLSDFNRSFFKQTTDLIDGIATSELHHRLRNDGFLITNDEYARLSPKVKNQYVQAKDVTTGTRSNKIPVFTTEIRGAHIHKKYADIFRRQQALQEAQSMAMQSDSAMLNTWRGIGNAVSRWTKLNLLIDFVNNSMLKNTYGAQFTQSFGHGDFVLDPTYVVKVRDYMNRLERGEIPNNPMLDRIIRAHANGQTSLKSDFYSTKVGDAWKNLLLDFNDHSATRKVLSDMKVLGDKSAASAVNNLGETLSLKNFHKGGEFLETLRTHDIDGSGSSQNIIFKGAKSLFEKIGVARQKMLEAYGRPDFYYKVGYQWMLEENKGYSPARAHKGALDTYIDYSDMSELVNFFRFGMGNPFSAEFLSEFAGFAANQVPAHFTLMTERPVRSFLLGQMARSYDAAINNTLKYRFTIQEMRDLLRDPTYNFVPFFTDAEVAIGSEYTGKQFYSGPAGFTGEEYTGTPGGIGEWGLPLLPTGQKGLNFNMPLDDRNITVDDILNQLGNISRAVGGMGNTAREAAQARRSVRERQVASEKPTSLTQPVVGELEEGSENSNIFDGVLDGPSPREQSRTYVDSVIGRTFPPRIIKSTDKAIGAYLERPVSILPGFPKQQEYKVTAWSKFAGLGIRPTDIGNVSLPGLDPKEKKSEINERLRSIQKDADKAKESGKEFDFTEYTALIEELDAIQEKLAMRQSAVSQAQIENIDMIKVQVYVKVLKGLMTEKEYTEFLKSYDE